MCSRRSKSRSRTRGSRSCRRPRRAARSVRSRPRCARRTGSLAPDYLHTQAFNGLVNGAYFALLALGLSVIFGMLRIVNFAHGAMFMLGAFVAYYGAQLVGLPFFPALIVAPVIVGLFGLLIEVVFLRRLYGLDPLYGLLFTFALVLILEDVMRVLAGALGSPHPSPAG